MHNVLTDTYRIRRNELVQLIHIEIFINIEKRIDCFGLLLKRCISINITKTGMELVTFLILVHISQYNILMLLIFKVFV